MKSNSTRLNERLHILATNTSCPCQRRTQCSADDGPGSGFIVAVALAADLDLKRGPSENDLIERAEKFCRSLEGRWALGDCGNSLIIVGWKHYSKMLICPAQLAKRYVTKEEERRILANVNGLIQSNQWFDALLRVIDDVQRELEGEPKGRTDIGTISLLVSVIVAFVLCLIIACCVCAFRCFGNLKSDETDRVRKAVKRVDSLRAEVMRRGSQLRRSFSRSPKFPLVKEGDVMQNQFFPDPDTTVV
uniref:RNase H domain-containing protein n=1 Tax=Syphacia muris TaxID=451379 RepID=A0A0N5AHR3_9BILA